MTAATTQEGRAGATTRSGFNRDRFENGLFKLLKPIVIVLLPIVAVFPFYYMVLLSFRSLDSRLQDPRALWITLDELDLSTYFEVLAPVSDGGQGFIVFMRNAVLVALSAVVLPLLVAIPGASAVSRLAFFGRRQVSGLFLAVYF